VVALSAVNIGLVMRREREPVWSSPVFPYLGWIILGWALTWAGVELGMLQRVLDTVSLTGRQWGVVMLLSLVSPTIVFVDKLLQNRRMNRTATATATAPAPAPAATTAKAAA
jgi:Ca2+-transporting ATPase